MVEPSKFYIIICTSTILSNIYIFNYYIYKCTYILYFKLHSFTLLKQSHSLIVLHSYLCIWLNCCGIISQVIIYLKVLKRWIWNLSVALFCSTLQAARCWLVSVFTLYWVGFLSTSSRTTRCSLVSVSIFHALCCTTPPVTLLILDLSPSYSLLLWFALHLESLSSLLDLPPS